MSTKFNLWALLRPSLNNVKRHFGDSWVKVDKNCMLDDI